MNDEDAFHDHGLEKRGRIGNKSLRPEFRRGPTLGEKDNLYPTKNGNTPLHKTTSENWERKKGVQMKRGKVVETGGFW